MTVFVEPLRDTHGALRAVVQLAAGLLLQRGGHKRRVRAAGIRFVLDRSNGEFGLLQAVGKLGGLLLVDDGGLAFELATVIKIAPLGHA